MRGITEQRPHREFPFGELAQRTIGEDREVNPVGLKEHMILIYQVRWFSS